MLCSVLSVWCYWCVSCGVYYILYITVIILYYYTYTIISYTILLLYLILYSSPLLLFCSLLIQSFYSFPSLILLPILLSFPSPLSSSDLFFLFQSSLPSISSSPLLFHPIPIFILYLSVLTYTYLYSLHSNLTPHVLSEWMVEV